MQPSNLSVKERIEISIDPKIKQQKIFVLVAGFDPQSHKAKNQEQQHLDTRYANLSAKFDPIFSKIGLNVTVVEVTLANFRSKIVSLCSDPHSNDTVFYSLCDGNENDGIPGASVYEFLEQQGYLTAGSCSSFAKISMSKACMKERFHKIGVETSPFVVVRDWAPDTRDSVQHLKYPLIIKPDQFYSSVGLSENSICHSINDLDKTVVPKLKEFECVIVEEFIEGHEFTVLVMEDISKQPFAVNVIELVFDESLPMSERWLSFKRRSAQSNKQYQHIVLPESPEKEKIKNLAVRAFNACHGKGYARIDIRRRYVDGNLFVLEVNENPGFGGNYAIDEMLENIGVSLGTFLMAIISNQGRARSAPVDI